MTVEQVAVADKALRTRALAVLREGRLHLMTVRPSVGADGPAMVDAIVYGHSGDHVVAFEVGKGWWCGCRGKVSGLCAHVLAAELVVHAVGEPGKGRP